MSKEIKVCYEGGLGAKNKISSPSHNRMSKIKGDEIEVLDESYHD